MSKQPTRPVISGGFRTLIIIAMVFIVLAVALALQTEQQAQIVPTSETPLYRVFPDLAVLDMQAIRLRAPETDDEWIITRSENGVWVAPDGASNTSENQVVERGVARTIALLPYTRTLDAQDDLATYGFTPEGILSIEVVLNDGQTHAVAVGFRNTSETDYFAFVDDRPELYLIDRAPVDFLIAILREQTA